MRAERVYAALLHLYPRRFRQRYGTEALQTFAELSAALHTRRVRFWLRVLTDLARSIVREHIDEWTCGDLSLAIRWVAGCVLGLLISRLGVMPLPAWARVFFLGAALGAGQGWALKQQVRVASLWSLTIGVAFAAPAALESAATAVFTLLKYQPIDVYHDDRRLILMLDFVGIAATCLPVAIAQALLIGRSQGDTARWLRTKDAARLIGWTTVAMPAAVLGARALGQVLPFPGYSTTLWWISSAVIRPSAIGTILGLLTVRPIAMVVGRERESAV